MYLEKFRNAPVLGNNIRGIAEQNLNLFYGNIDETTSCFCFFFSINGSSNFVENLTTSVPFLEKKNK